MLTIYLLTGMIPLWTYPMLLKADSSSVADAIAVYYESVSAVVFVSATNFLQHIDEPYQIYAQAFIAVMKSPALLVGVMFGEKLSLRNVWCGGAMRGSI